MFMGNAVGIEVEVLQQIEVCRLGLRLEIVPLLKAFRANLSGFCVMWKSQVPVTQRWIMLSAHYSGDRTVCFVNACPLHIDLCIWWIAFSTPSTTRLFFADASTTFQKYYSSNHLQVHFHLLFKANSYNIDWKRC